MAAWEEWQRPYRFGTIVIRPPDEVRETVNSQRAEYDPVSQAYCQAHISVTQPLSRPLDGEEWRQVSELLLAHEPFEIRFGPVNSFLPYPCIWYEIHPAEKILAIRSDLHQTGFFNLAMKHPKDFIPHMTVTEGLSGPAVDQGLLERIGTESSKGSFLCEELAYIVPNEAFRFEVASTFPLSSGGP
jgi:2'-5' RNA ligase